MKLNESIIKIRVELQNSKINNSGKNKFQGFTYYELSDFLPKLNELMLENGVNDIISIEDNHATLTLVKGEERETYAIPFNVYDTPLNKQGGKSMQDIQYLGALNTYYKRYLYLNAFGITDGEVIDSMNIEELNAIDQKAIAIKKALPQKLKLECPDEDKLRQATNLTLSHFKIRNWKSLDFTRIKEQDFLNVFVEKVATL